MPSRGPSQGGIGLRRNGKEKACEPCRKGKLACDHAVPVCGRCVRRKITERCLYHPAPMTKARDTQPIINSSTEHQTDNTSTHISSGKWSPQRGMNAIDPLLHQTPNNYVQEPEILSQESENSTPTDSTNRLIKTSSVYDWDHDSDFRRSARYYGPTSFSAVFNEGAKLSEDLNIGEAGKKHPANWPFGQPLLGRERPSAPSVRMNQVVKALWNIPSKESCERLLGMFEFFHNYLMNPIMIRHCIETLWSNFGTMLTEPRTSEKLELIAEVLFKNEEKPFPAAPKDGMDWLDGFMGQNMRFEMMGILFCFFGVSYQTLQEWDEVFQVPENHGRDRKEASWRMKECADVCLKMCEISEENNEISITLMVQASVLESVCTGDESFQLRRRCADLIACTIAAGLHRLPDYGTDQITAASEWKIRLVSVVYAAEINHASLNGTPPGFSSRYCIVRLPLDISCEDLFLPQAELAKIAASLDRSGWDSSKNLHRASFHRAKQLLASIREEILEISLGIDVVLSGDKIDDLYRQCQESYDTLPEKLKYHTNDRTLKDSEGRDLVSQAYLMLNSLQNRFLVDRIAVTRGFPNAQRLLNTALELMDMVNMFWIKRDQLMPFTYTFDWIFTCYGIPAAGVICVELLKQATGQTVLQFSRSEAVQKLTMFIGFLEWIRPTDGNYLLAGRLKKVVRRILDRVLDPPPQMSASNALMDIPIDPMLAPFGEMDWLNTIDWTQGDSWMELN